MRHSVAWRVSFCELYRGPIVGGPEMQDRAYGETTGA
eukprot:COSAG02_NODE_48617_length_332_cov_1.025751_1_plen_36_part_01